MREGGRRLSVRLTKRCKDATDFEDGGRCHKLTRWLETGEDKEPHPPLETPERSEASLTP